jgi:hypothetical protein
MASPAADVAAKLKAVEQQVAEQKARVERRDSRIAELEKKLASDNKPAAAADKKPTGSPGALDRLFKPANKSSVPKEFFIVGIVFGVLSIGASVAGMIYFPDMIIPILTGLVLWLGLLVIWQVVIHYVSRALWTTSPATVRWVAVVPYITGAVLGLVLLAAVLRDAEIQPPVDQPCYPNMDDTQSPVPPFSPDAKPATEPVPGWRFNYTTGTCVNADAAS